MDDHQSTWSRITAMAHARYTEDLDRAELHVMAALDAEQTTEYAREDDLYGPYQEGMGESAARVVVAQAEERGPPESLCRQPPTATQADIQAANASLAEVRALLRESREALRALGSQPERRLPQ
jgi:hypothetical protein